MARRVVADYAAKLAGMGEQQLHAVRLAVSEAATNVVAHAYRGGAGDVHLTAGVVPGELWVLVADDGCGYRTPSLAPGLGWGFALMADACDELVVTERSSGGTEIRMRFLLSEPRI